MASSTPGATSILQAVEMRGETDTRPSYFVHIILPFLLVLGGLAAAAAAVLAVAGATFPGLEATEAAWEQWLAANLAVLAGGAGLFILAVLAAIVLVVVGVYKLIKRRNEHLARDRVLRQGLLELTREQADTAGEDEQGAQHGDQHLEAMERLHNEALLEENERSAALHLLISFLTFGLWFYYVIYFLLKDLPRHSRRQARFTHHANAVLASAELGEEELPSMEPIPERSFMLFVGLVALLPTLGSGLLTAAGLSDLYGTPLNLIATAASLVFWYWIFEDPKVHLDRQWAYEDRLVPLVRGEAPEPDATGTGPLEGRPEPALQAGAEADEGTPDTRPAAAGTRQAAEAAAPEAPEDTDGPAAPSGAQAEEEPPAFTVWACAECGKRYKVPPKRPVRVTCKDCGNQEILRE